MSAPDLRVGLIGFGYAGRTFHAPLIGATEGLAITAVASSRPDAVREVLGDVAVVADPHALIAADVDVVVVATPNDGHAPLARAALAAGRHVVVEKPFALTLDEARGVAAAVEAAGRVLAVFHNRRWDSDFLAVEGVIRDGLAGRVVQFESHFDRFRPEVRNRWREGDGPGAGVWYDLAPHLADQALALFGLPDAVEASVMAARDGAVADDWAHGVLHYPQMRVILHASMIAAGGGARFTVHGTGGSIIKTGADRQEAQLLDGMVPGAAGWGADPDRLRWWDADGAVHERAAPAGDQRGFYRGLVAAIRDGAPPPVAPIEALAAMAVVEAGLVSAREGRRVPLPLTPAERAAWAAR